MAHHVSKFVGSNSPHHQPKHGGGGGRKKRDSKGRFN